MSTLTAPHAVRIGHTEFVRKPLPAPAACCSRGSACWCATDHVREKSVAHARQAGHDVLVGEGRAVTRVEVTS